jgi:hypothetical protein
MDLRSLQREALTKALTTTTTSTTSPNTNTTTLLDAPSTTWRVLVYDKHCRDVVFSLSTSKKNIIRECAVTLRMLIDSPRERIPDVAAVYLIRPTEENVDLCARDAAQHLYDSFHVNFSSPVSSHVLDRFAKKVGEAGVASSIARVFDQFMGFIALERGLFTLNQNDSFISYNSTKANEIEVERVMEAMADGLVDACVVMGRVPIIRAPRDGPAKMVAHKVAIKLEKLYKERVFTLETSAVDQRPVLLILDRGFDMSTPLQHSETYQCLVDDLAGPIKLNKLQLLDEVTKKSNMCDLDPEVDAFWGEHEDSAFPHAIEKQVEIAKELDERAKRMAGGGGIINNNVQQQQHNNNNGNDVSSSSIRELMDAANSLPEVTALKRSLAMHNDILQNVFRSIKNRVIPTFHDIETRLARSTSGRVTQTLTGEVMTLLKSPQHFAEDKTRLACIYILTARPNSSSEMDEVETILLSGIENQGEKMEAKRALQFVRRVLTVSNTMAMNNNKSTRNTMTTSSGVGGAAASGMVGMESLLASTLNWQVTFSGVQEKLQTLLTGTDSITCPAARTLHAVCGGDRSSTFTQQESMEIDKLVYLDPKAKIMEVPADGARFRGQINRAILFMVGGGSYTEYHNVKVYAQQRKREVVYGCTELMNAGEFLRQMKESA